MIKLNEIIKQYGDYEVDEEKLKEILVKPTPKNVWKLDFGDVYYLVGTNGSILKNHWNNVDSELSRRENGNVFLTKEEAQFELERRKIEAILLKYGRRNFKYAKPNYFIYYEANSVLRIDHYNTTQVQGIIYFDTLKLCQKAIDEAGEENIKKYIFGVDEDDSTQTDTKEN